MTKKTQKVECCPDCGVTNFFRYVDSEPFKCTNGHYFTKPSKKEIKL